MNDINNENEVVLFNELMSFTDVEECKTCLRENFGEQALVDALACAEMEGVATLDDFALLWVSESFKRVVRGKQNDFVRSLRNFHTSRDVGYFLSVSGSSFKDIKLLVKDELLRVMDGLIVEKDKVILVMEEKSAHKAVFNELLNPLLATRPSSFSSSGGKRSEPSSERLYPAEKQRKINAGASIALLTSQSQEISGRDRLHDKWEVAMNRMIRNRLDNRIDVSSKLAELGVPGYRPEHPLDPSLDDIRSKLLAVLRKFVGLLDLSRIATSDAERFVRGRAIPCGVALEKEFVQPMFADLLNLICDAFPEGYFTRESRAGHTINDVSFVSLPNKAERPGYGTITPFMELKPVTRARVT